MVLINSRRVPRVPRYLGGQHRKSDAFRVQDCHLLRCAFPDTSTIRQFGNFPSSPKPAPVDSHDPECATLSGFNTHSVWAVSRSLAATRKITVVFSS
jgi:hypothetical protein